MLWIEIVGYAGSALVALASTMSNLKRLRYYSLAGALLFVAYAAMLELWPIFAVNLFIAGTNIYHIYRIKFARDYFTLNETLSGTEYFIGQFLEFYSDDIENYFPEFSIEALEDPNVIVIMRNLNPVGLFVYTVEGEHVLRIHMDYAVPAYRDMKNGRILLNRTVRKFRELGYLQFVTQSTYPKHQAYLGRLGFVVDEDGKTFRRAV
jgi:hypothetical protein